MDLRLQIADCRFKFFDLSFIERGVFEKFKKKIRRTAGHRGSVS